MGTLTGKIALVTGAGRGIGAATAKKLTESGAKVLVNDLDEEVAQSVANTLPGAIAHTGDLTDLKMGDELVETAIQEFGGLDIVVNNAGIHAAGRFLDIDPATYSRLFEVNVVGIVRVSHAFLEGMIERGRGSIVNIASTAGLFESPGQAPYNASKHGAVGLTRCMGLELAASGVTCNAICPGFVDTPMLEGFAELVGAESDALRAQLAQRTPMGRILTPDEVANLAIYLGSDGSSGMTGQTMAISNGMRMS